MSLLDNVIIRLQNDEERGINMYIIYLAIGYVFYLLSIAIHVLVMTKRLSYTWVNGGRSTSFDAQYKTSLISIIILMIGIIILMTYHIFPSIKSTLFGVILMGILTLYWLFGLMMQYLGTRFEKRVVSFIVLLGVFSHFMLFLEYFTTH